MIYEYTRNQYIISTDLSKLDPDAIYAYLSRSYWATGRPISVVRHSLQHSLCFGLYHTGEQVGLARVIGDYATFAYLCDVYILEEHQGQGLGKWLIETVVSHPDLVGLRQFLLATRDAHGLYSQYGFEPLPNPERWMRILRA